MTTLTTDQIAQICWDNYYKSDLTGITAITEYLDGWDEHDTTFDNFVDALHLDIRDLLHNGNQEDLFGPDMTAEETDELSTYLHDGWEHDPDPLELVCEAIARLSLDTI